MPVISCYVDDEDYQMLQFASQETDRKIDELAAAAIADAVNDWRLYYRHRSDSKTKR